MRLFLLLSAALTACLARPGEAASVYFTHEGSKPGAARVEIAEGRLSEIEALPLGEDVSKPFKLALAPGGEVVAVSAGGDKDARLFLVPAAGATGQARSIPLPSPLSDIAPAPGGFLAALSKGHLLLVDAREGKVAAEINARKHTSPPARKGEHVCLLPGGHQALVSFQKDDNDSPALGNRLLLLGIEPFGIDADIALPRERPRRGRGYAGHRPAPTRPERSRRPSPQWLQRPNPSPG
ncbi:MAG: hypothetical protein N2322_07695, partial [Terrimicrobiaceae bacterium]|nr:hypothetical protein [Terrimicrobiaceae bacterium]